jgi:Tol biopolymer transport system component/predicted Ser/Thr protein kinase
MDEFVAGSMLGPYRIEGFLGAGGMARVYRARDTRLDRAVAIKTSDERFTERFTREARAISALNHPHICTLYDVGPNYLVMELVDGETLADRLRRGPIPLDETLAIAAELADALEAAHEKGIIHRDLKPANITLSRTGGVKVLDFGIAKLAQHDGVYTAEAQLTQTGAVLGTSGYMAPEQVQGRAVDKRADIWAFGVVVYEMLTGERLAIGGFSQPGVEAAFAAEPRWRVLPSHVQRLLRLCLAPDPRHRLRDIGDAGLLLEGEVSTSKPTGPSRRVVVGALLGATGGVAVGAWGWLRPGPVASVRPTRFVATLPVDARVYQEAVAGSSIALSPDGNLLVIATTGREERELFVRKLDDLEATALPGTTGAAAPFFSPDGRWIGFYADGQLRRVPKEGGPPVTITEAPGSPTGASWGQDGRIVFTCGWRSPLYAVSSNGGAASTIAALESPDIFMRSPELLPDSTVVLVDISNGTTRALTAINWRTGQRVVVTEGSTCRYVSTGHLLVGRGATVLVAPFDTRSLALTGPLVPLIEGVSLVAGGVQHYAVSDEDTVAYVPGIERYALVLIDLETGAELSVIDQRVRFHRPRFDPEGRRVAVGVADSRGLARSADNVWIYDVAGTAPGRQVTTEGGSGPIWTRDGASIAFGADPGWTRRAEPGLYSRSLAGGARDEQLVALTEFHRPIGWTPDRSLLFEFTTDDGVFLIHELSAGGERREVVRGTTGRLSPDGQWLAYVSDRTGRETIYVTDFSGRTAATPIAEGRDPAWGPGGKLYFWRGNQLRTATIGSDGTRISGPSAVLDSTASGTPGDYDISPDGRTLALVRPFEPTRGREIVVSFDSLS